MLLLELPLEIRNEIYRWTFADVVVMIDLVRYPDKMYEQCKTTLPACFNVVLACSQTRREAENLFHQTVSYVSNNGVSLATLQLACPKPVRAHLGRLYGLDHRAISSSEELMAILPALRILGLNSPVGDVHSLFSDMSMNSVEWGGVYSEQRIRGMTYRELVDTAMFAPRGMLADWIRGIQALEEHPQIVTILQINLMCTTPALFGYVPIISVPVLLDLHRKTVTKDFTRPRSARDLRNKRDMTWVETAATRSYII